MRLLLIAVGALALLTANAHAGWSGCHVGAFAGVSSAQSDTGISSPLLPGYGLNLSNLGSEGAHAGIKGGCDAEITKGFLVGVTADWAYQDVEWKGGLTTPFGGIGLSTSIKDQWSIGGRAGFIVSEKTLIFGSAGYTQANTDDLAVSSPFGGLSWSVGTLKGWYVGGGFETVLLPNVTLGLEYRYVMFDAANVYIPELPANVRFENDSHVVRASLNYQFAFPLAGN